MARSRRNNKRRGNHLRETKNRPHHQSHLANPIHLRASVPALRLQLQHESTTRPLSADIDDLPFPPPPKRIPSGRDNRAVNQKCLVENNLRQHEPKPEKKHLLKRKATTRFLNSFFLTPLSLTAAAGYALQAKNEKREFHTESSDSADSFCT